LSVSPVIDAPGKQAATSDALPKKLQTSSSERCTTKLLSNVEFGFQSAKLSISPDGGAASATGCAICFRSLFRTVAWLLAPAGPSFSRPAPGRCATPRL